MKRVRVLLVWGFSVLIALVMISQGWAKFFEDGHWTRSFAEWGYPAWFRFLIGGIELGAALGLVIPRVAYYGASALAAVMLGAFGTLILNGRGWDAASPLVYAVVLAWIAWERWQRRAADAPSRASA